MSQSYDLVVIGSGPGGYVAAARASAQGLKTAIVEKDKALGGTCLNRGCIPTKALLHAADLVSEINEAPQFGIQTEGVRVDFGQVQKYKNRVVSTNAGGVSHLMKKRNVEVYTGFGKLASSTSVVVESGKEKKELSTKYVLIAVGSEPRCLPMVNFDQPRVLSSDTILELNEIPGSLTVIGGGVIGLEFASVFSRMGTKVTILEALPRILAPADADCSKEMVVQLEKQGIQIHTDVKVEDIKPKKNSVQTQFSVAGGDKQVIDTEYLLISIGRSPVTANIGLDKTKVKTDDKGFVVVNGYMQTDDANIYAIGDCVNTPWLAHVASAEGQIAVKHMLGEPATPLNYDHIPSCVYSEPQVAWSGLTEAQAKEQGYEVKVGRFDLMRSGKASILGKKRGFFKFVSDAQYGEILGVHIIGPQATELLAEPAFAMQMEATIEDIAHAVHAHPTLYESLYEAASVAIDEAVHG